MALLYIIIEIVQVSRVKIKPNRPTIMANMTGGINATLKSNRICNACNRRLCQPCVFVQSLCRLKER